MSNLQILQVQCAHTTVPFIYAATQGVRGAAESFWECFTDALMILQLVQGMGNTRTFETQPLTQKLYPSWLLYARRLSPV